MNSFRRRALALAATVTIAAAVAPAFAQDLHPSRRPSPMGMARITLGETYIRVVYNRPYERGRDNIFGTKESGAVVPYGELWRTGANEATEITVTGDVLVAGKPLAAGTYSLFTTPGPEQWKVHFNRELGLDGAGRFDDATETFTPIDVAATDALVVNVTSSKLAEKVDQLTIDFEPSALGADLVLRWITTEVRVPMAVAKAAGTGGAGR